MVTPPESVPVEKVMVRRVESPDPDTAAVAAGEPAVGATTRTVFADRLNAKVPVKVTSSLPPLGMALMGVTVSVIETDDAP